MQAWGAEPAPTKTGRSIVLFHRKRAAETVRAFGNVLGIRASALAGAQDFEAARPMLFDAGLMFHGLGVAVLNQPPEEAIRVCRSSASPVTAVRPEYVLQIPRYRVSPPRLNPLALTALAKGVVDLTWALQATAVDRSRADGKGVRVAVLDTGISPHADLPAGPPELRSSFIAGDPSPLDPVGHGTHCAGLVAGALRPAKGPRYAVAPGATLLAGRVADRDGHAPESVVLAAIDWALRGDCRVISLSLGVPIGQAAQLDPLYEKVGSVAAESRCLIVAAAGNESQRSIDQPAASTNVMAVTAETRAGVIAVWANRGAPSGRAAVDLTAPGVDIQSAWNDGGYRSLEGTSCATPIVAAIAALFFQRFPDAASADIWKRMGALALPIVDPVTKQPFSPIDAGAGLVQAPR